MTRGIACSAPVVPASALPGVGSQRRRTPQPLQPWASPLTGASPRQLHALPRKRRTVGVNEDPGIAIPCGPDWVVRVVLKHQAERPAHPRLSEFLLLPKGDVSIHLHRAQVAEASFSLGDTKHRLARATEDSP